MPRLTEIITIGEKEAFTLVGSGGKTTTMWLLAGCNQHMKTLVTTTTKFFRSKQRQFVDYRDSLTLLVAPIVPGITLAGDSLPEDERDKLGALDPAVLEKGRGLFDRILIEGDGSRQLPLKAWADYEPVVPDFTTCTVGVVTLWPVGKAVDESIVFRLPLFCAISGAREGEALTVEHIAAVIAHPQGLWKGSRGRRILFINQADDKAGMDRAASLLQAIRPEALQAMHMVVAGSARDDRGEVLWRQSE